MYLWLSIIVVLMWFGDDLIIYLEKDGPGAQFKASLPINFDVLHPLNGPPGVVEPKPDLIAGILSYWVSRFLFLSWSRGDRAQFWWYHGGQLVRRLSEWGLSCDRWTAGSGPNDLVFPSSFCRYQLSFLLLHLRRHAMKYNIPSMLYQAEVDISDPIRITLQDSV